MNKFVVVIVALVAFMVPKAHALVDLHLDNNDLTVTAPASGTTTVDLTGTISLTGGWTVNTTVVQYPFNTSGDYLQGDYDSSFLNWLVSGQTTNYSGAIFDFTVLPTSDGYYFLSNGSISQISVTGADPTNTYSYTSSEDFGIQVNPNPAPEPASLLALGGLGAALLRRRSKKH